MLGCKGLEGRASHSSRVKILKHMPARRRGGGVGGAVEAGLGGVPGAGLALPRDELAFVAAKGLGLAAAHGGAGLAGEGSDSEQAVEGVIAAEFVAMGHDRAEEGGSDRLHVREGAGLGKLREADGLGEIGLDLDRARRRRRGAAGREGEESEKGRGAGHGRGRLGRPSAGCEAAAGRDLNRVSTSGRAGPGATWRGPKVPRLGVTRFRPSSTSASGGPRGKGPGPGRRCAAAS